jgi:hypothetical protein
MKFTEPPSEAVRGGGDISRSSASFRFTQFLSVHLSLLEFINQMLDKAIRLSDHGKIRLRD